jgi:hypothetical protein
MFALLPEKVRRELEEEVMKKITGQAKVPVLP